MPDDFKFSSFTDTGIYFYRTNKSSNNNKVHFKQNVICFLLEGNKVVSNGKRTKSFGNDKVLLLQASNVLMTEKTTVNNAYKMILMFFSNDFLSRFVENKKLLLEKKPKNNFNFSLLMKDNYISNFEDSLLFFENKPLISEHFIATKLEEILLYLIERERPVLTDFIHTALQSVPSPEIIEVIKNPANINLTVEELAFLCSMSISTFKRKFAEIYNTSPKKYFIEQKMKQAVYWLRQNKRPSEIYYELGYENLSAFSNEFKKCFGVSPSTYILQN
ncbi:MAG TPA: AraC family transcriptional regulator [Chitinophagaceae bacterium]|jgi:AraC-like DNA-binding protein|nr:AraC family transcriptional regulator [Chitinophagaceae bacterium]